MSEPRGNSQEDFFETWGTFSRFLLLPALLITFFVNAWIGVGLYICAIVIMRVAFWFRKKSQKSS